MHISIKKAFTSNIALKVISFIIAYSLWSIIAEEFHSYYWFKVPLCYYNNHTYKTITGPHHLWIQLKGKRSIFSSLDTKSLAVHINSEMLNYGPNALTLHEDMLFLPAALALNNYIPHNIIITVT